jgi:MoxR-like ATPase
LSARRPKALLDALAATVVGQSAVLEALVLAVIADGHLLLEGPPGLAKTLACRALARAVGGSFKRVQFTPDLLPSDIVGTRIFDQKNGDFATALGPIFANIVLADEINRAPAKVQSALLEAMQERQVTIGLQTHPLPDPFVVLATMNPLEHEGTYALPLAQNDRFLMKVLVGYPTAEEEAGIVRRFGGEPPELQHDIVSLEDITAWRHAARAIFVEPRVIEYAVRLVGATREKHPHIEGGASPRATLALIALARARALLGERDYVLPDDVRASALDAMRHRISPTYQAIKEGVGLDSIVERLVATVAPP